MSRQRRPLYTARRRIAVSALAFATTVVMAPLLATVPAPTAMATPESDADGAITAAWTGSGGDTGPLGPREGDVFPVGDGFGQDFAGGKIYFTPATGAHIMQGAILDKYESLGGPADSDLGFPTIDEGPGKVSPDSRNTTFSGPDKPVIFWTPPTGAWVVRGAINAAWDKVGGSAGPLGVPTEDESFHGDAISQKFTGGEVTWDRKAKTFTTTPPELADQLAGLQVPDDPASAISTARRAAGGPLGPLGAKQGKQYPIGPDGVGQDFAGGKIFYSPKTGANVVTGQVLEKYESVGGPEGDLGFPTSSEDDGGFGANSRTASFAAADKPVIFWTPDYGAVIVRGAMNAAWDKLGGAKGTLGAPMADQTQNNDTITQRFSGGAVSWDRKSGKFSTEPANLSSKLRGLQVPGQELPKAPQASEPDNGKSFAWHWNWWWLLVIVPVLLLAGLVTGAVLVHQRRRNADARFEGDQFDDGYGGFGGPGERDFDGDYEGGHDDGPEQVREPVPSGDTAAHFAEPYGEQPAQRLAGETAPADEHWGPPAGDAAESDAPYQGHAVPTAPPDVELFGDPDRVDTTPNRIVSDPDDEHVEPQFDEPETHSGRHAAIQLEEEPAPGHTAFQLPRADAPQQAPDGYPVKADTRSGLFWSPGSRLYDDVVPEIWFASEEMARTNGFVKGE